MFLTDEELRELTGYAQRGVLRKAWDYFTTRSLNHRRDLPRSWLGQGAFARSFSVLM